MDNIDDKKAVKRTQKAKMRLFASYIELLENKHYYEITIDELSNHANVHRTTFYKYFNSIYDLKRQLEDMHIDLFYNRTMGVFEYAALPVCYDIEMLFPKNGEANNVMRLFGKNGDVSFVFRAMNEVESKVLSRLSGKYPHADQAEMKLWLSYIMHASLYEYTKILANPDRTKEECTEMLNISASLLQRFFVELENTKPAAAGGIK